MNKTNNLAFFRYLLAQQDLALYKERATKQTQQIADLELEIQQLRKQLEALETEREKDRKTIDSLQELLLNTRSVNNCSSFNESFNQHYISFVVVVQSSSPKGFKSVIHELVRCKLFSASNRNCIRLTYISFLKGQTEKILIPRITWSCHTLFKTLAVG
jgi:septal ring factor EnvC (AmiA/AmiB activator)